MKRLSERRGGFSDTSKRSKLDSQRTPRRVVFIGGLPNDAAEGDVIQLGLPFGRMTNLVFAKKKCQALLEMSDLESAEAMVQYYSERPPRLGSHTMIVRFSNYEELKTEPTAQNAGAAAALKAADELMDTADKPQSVLRIVIDNMIYPVTLEVIHKIFSKFGQVVRIVTYVKNNLLHAFVEYANAVVASAAKNSLHGQNIYNGGCTLRVDFSNMSKLSVKFNNDKMWDYTRPDLPSGDERMMERDFPYGAAAVDDMRDRRMPTRNTPRGRMPLDDDNDGDIDDDFGPGGFGGNMRSMGGIGGGIGPTEGNMERMAGGSGFGGNMRNMSGIGGGVGPVGGNMERMDGDIGFGGNMRNMSGIGGGVGPMEGNIERMAGGSFFGGNMRSMGGIGGGGGGGSMGGNMEMMGESNIMSSMMMNRMGGMMGAGLMAGVGGGPMGLMGTNLDGLSRLASEMEQMNAMQGNLRGMAGASGNMRRAMDFMERGRERDDRMERGGGPRSRRDTSEGQQQEAESIGMVVLVSNMNHERISTDSIFTLFGVYGNVLRVKILFNKKDSALVEYSDPQHAFNACMYLSGVRWWGRSISVRPSKAKHVKMPREGDDEPWLTKDYSNSDMQRFTSPNSKNFHHIFPPSATLHLSNIAANATEELLRELFSEHGRVEAFRFFQKDRKMAYIQMGSAEEAISALVELHNYELNPKSHLRVSFTQTTIRD